MTKTISAKKKFKKCLRINTVLANVGRCGGGHLWLLLYPFVLLDKNEPKNQGRHHRSQRTKRALPRHVGQAHAPNPVKYQHSHSQHLRFPAGMEVYIERPAAASNDYDPETLQTAAWYLITITPFPKGISQHYTPTPYRHREEEQACHEQSAVEAIHL